MVELSPQLGPTSTQPISRAARVAVHAGARASVQATTDTAHVWELPRIYMRAPVVGHAVWSHYGHRPAHAESAFGVWSQRWHLCGSSWHCWWRRPAATADAPQVLTASPTKTGCWHSMLFRQTCGHTAITPVITLPPSHTGAWPAETPHGQCTPAAVTAAGAPQISMCFQPDDCPSQASWVQ